MHTLHLTGFDPNKFIDVVRGVRAAMTALGAPSTTSAMAAAVVNMAVEAGHALLGEHPDREVVERALTALVNESNGYANGIIDAFPYDLMRPAPAPEDDSEDFEASDATWRAAIVLMASANGNPLVAAAHARNLYAVTDVDLFREVILCLASSFPHYLPQALIEQGFLSDEPHTSEP
jgi:hypothetical protein